MPPRRAPISAEFIDSDLEESQNEASVNSSLSSEESASESAELEAGNPRYVWCSFPSDPLDVLFVQITGSSYFLRCVVRPNHRDANNEGKIESQGQAKEVAGWRDSNSKSKGGLKGSR